MAPPSSGGRARPGGWWSHVTHPADGHDAETQVEVDERMDDNGYWHTVGVKAVES